MSSHTYAFKFSGKTLGIRDIDQLIRLIDSGKLTEKDSVFLISAKRWIPILELEEYTAAVSSTSASGTEYSVADQPAVDVGIPSSNLASLIDDVSGQTSASSSNIQNTEFVFDTGRTIYKSPNVKNRTNETMVAVKVPMQDNGNHKTTAVLTAVFVLLFGLAVGFLSAFEINENAVPQGSAILQAQTTTPAPTSITE